MLEKNKIILFAALAITFLVNLPRFLITLMRSDLAENFGLTYSEVGLRTVIMFCFSWLVLTYNIKWKTKFKFQATSKNVLRDIAANALFLIVGIAALTFFRQFISDSFIDPRGYVFISFFIYLFILIMLLIFSRLVNVMTLHQQNIIEKEQAKRKALYHQLEALRAQINPHFLFNILNSLNSLIRQKSDKAPVFVEKLSWLLRTTLQQSDKDYITLQEELNYLEAYVFLQKERFGDKLTIEIDIPENWKKTRIPSFSLQLLVENAIKHNVVSNKQPLNVRIFTTGNYLTVSNAIQERRDVVDSTGKGLSNLSTRFQLLKKEDIQIEKTKDLFLVKLPVL